MSNRLFIVSELYYPEETSTGYFVTGIAEGLAGRTDYSVEVLCAQPTYSQLGVSAPENENKAGVSIERLGAPKADKNKLLGRAWIFFILTIRFGWRLLRRIRKGDTVLVLTNPPSLPLLVALIASMKQARAVLLVHDVYPEVLVPAGFTCENSLLYRCVDAAQRWMLNRMSAIVVLGRDMQSRLAGKLKPGRPEPRIIPNWGDGVAIRPDLRNGNALRVKLRLQDKFIIQFSGNLGRTHGLEDLVTLAAEWKANPQIHFLIFGWGAGRVWLEAQIAEHALENVTLLEPCEKSELGVYLTACDLFFMPFKKGMEGISVPSRLYNVMAAGSPVLAVADPSSELALVVEEESMGWVVPPGDLVGMAAAIEAAFGDREALRQMGRRARRAMEDKYTRAKVVEVYTELFQGLSKDHD